MWRGRVGQLRRGRGRPPGAGKLAPYMAMLIRWVEAQSDISMPELMRARIKVSVSHGISPMAEIGS